MALALRSDTLVRTPPLGIEYICDAHKHLPHVVKFSGGRSSGMMLMALLDAGILDCARGDVVIFNNTSAEHPATYDFVRRCTEYTEQAGIPFFWLEHASYEDASGGGWIRRSTFRLVNKQPISEENPDGYHWRGEVFEEMVSQAGFLPSRHTRICTAHLKLLTTNNFLAEWFAAKEATEHRGHYYAEPLITDEEVTARHRKARGKTPDDVLLRKKEYIRGCPPARAAQKFSDFSDIGAAHLADTTFASDSLGDVAPLEGPNAIDYVSLIGLRADEPLRVARVKQRNHAEPGSAERGATKMPDGEIVYTPLADGEVDKNAVLAFWTNQPWQLALPDDGNLSNCVYCFMKGPGAVARLRDELERADDALPPDLRSVLGTPSDIAWWADIEERYLRTPDKRSQGKADSGETVAIGFWGVDAQHTYRSLQSLDLEKRPIASSTLPCDCTD